MFDGIVFNVGSRWDCEQVQSWCCTVLTVVVASKILVVC